MSSTLKAVLATTAAAVEFKEITSDVRANSVPNPVAVKRAATDNNNSNKRDLSFLALSRLNLSGSIIGLVVGGRRFVTSRETLVHSALFLKIFATLQKRRRNTMTKGLKNPKCNSNNGNGNCDDHPSALKQPTQNININSNSNSNSSGYNNNKDSNPTGDRTHPVRMSRLSHSSIVSDLSTAIIDENNAAERLALSEASEMQHPSSLRNVSQTEIEFYDDDDVSDDDKTTILHSPAVTDEEEEEEEEEDNEEEEGEKEDDKKEEEENSHLIIFDEPASVLPDLPAGVYYTDIPHCFFIDRDPDQFSLILQYLRNSDTEKKQSVVAQELVECFPSHLALKKFEMEAKFYQIPLLLTTVQEKIQGTKKKKRCHPTTKPMSTRPTSNVMHVHHKRNNNNNSTTHNSNHSNYNHNRNTKHIRPAVYRWWDRSGPLQGLRRIPGTRICFATSVDNYLQKRTVFDIPDGFSWATQAEYLAEHWEHRQTLKDNQEWIHHGIGGWNNYTWKYCVNTGFVFRDTFQCSRYVHSGMHVWDIAHVCALWFEEGVGSGVLEYDEMFGIQEGFAGLVLLADNIFLPAAVPPTPPPTKENSQALSNPGSLHLMSFREMRESSQQKRVKMEMENEIKLDENPNEERNSGKGPPLVAQQLTKGNLLKHTIIEKQRHHQRQISGVENKQGFKAAVDLPAIPPGFSNSDIDEQSPKPPLPPPPDQKGLPLPQTQAPAKTAQVSVAVLEPVLEPMQVRNVLPPTNQPFQYRSAQYGMSSRGQQPPPPPLHPFANSNIVQSGEPWQWQQQQQQPPSHPMYYTQSDHKYLNTFTPNVSVNANLSPTQNRSLSHSHSYPHSRPYNNNNININNNNNHHHQRVNSNSMLQSPFTLQ